MPTLDRANIEMDFKQIEAWLRESLTRNVDAGHRGDRPFDPEQPLHAAAVLIAIILRDEPMVLFTQRTAHLSQHAGQISLPGGRAEPFDPDLEATALRECQEEVGLAPEAVTVVGRLPDYFTVTGYRVTPVVGLIQPPIELMPDPNEVALMFEAPLRLFLDRNNFERHAYELPGRSGTYLAVTHGPHFIWGATAGILMTLCEYIEG